MRSKLNECVTTLSLSESPRQLSTLEDCRTLHAAAEVRYSRRSDSDSRHCGPLGSAISGRRPASDSAAELPAAPAAGAAAAAAAPSDAAEPALSRRLVQPASSEGRPAEGAAAAEVAAPWSLAEVAAAASGAATAAAAALGACSAGSYSLRCGVTVSSRYNVHGANSGRVLLYTDPGARLAWTP